VTKCSVSRRARCRSERQMSSGDARKVGQGARLCNRWPEWRRGKRHILEDVRRFPWLLFDVIQADAYHIRVAQCAAKLPENKPRYCMGIGYGEGMLSSELVGFQAAHLIRLQPRSSRMCSTRSRLGLLLCLPKHAMRRFIDLSTLQADCVFPTRTAVSLCLQRDGKYSELT
jgi:hypothetical protein